MRRLPGWAGAPRPCSTLPLPAAARPCGWGAGRQAGRQTGGECEAMLKLRGAAVVVALGSADGFWLFEVGALSGMPTSQRLTSALSAARLGGRGAAAPAAGCWPGPAPPPCAPARRRGRPPAHRRCRPAHMAEPASQQAQSDLLTCSIQGGNKYPAVPCSTLQYLPPPTFQMGSSASCTNSGLARPCWSALMRTMRFVLGW